MTSQGDGDQEIYGGYSVDDEDQPGNIDDLGDPDVADELDRGYSPPENYSAGQGYGNTPWEEEHREGIDQRIAQEEPESGPVRRVRRRRPRWVRLRGRRGRRRARRPAGRRRPGVGEDQEKDLVGDDVGIDDARRLGRGGRHAHRRGLLLRPLTDRWQD